MRKQCRRTVRRAVPPMLVNRGLMDGELSMREHQFVEAFSGGWADKEHFDSLTDMRNVLTIAAAHKDDQQMLAMCHAMSIPLQNIRARHAQTGRMGVTGDELRLMREFVEVYRDFWLRQPVSLYEESVDALQVALGHAAGMAIRRAA